MSNPVKSSQPADDQREHFKIQVKGHLGPSWSDYFGPLKVTDCQNGETILAGPIVDQAELYGILARIRDLNLVLISLCRVRSKTQANEDHNSDVQQ